MATTRRRSGLIRAHGPGRRGVSCEVCGRSHSKSSHWSHKKKRAKYYFGQTPRPKGRKTPWGNRSRGVTAGSGGNQFTVGRRKARRVSGKSGSASKLNRGKRARITMRGAPTLRPGQRRPKGMTRAEAKRLRAQGAPAGSSSGTRRRKARKASSGRTRRAGTSTTTRKRTTKKASGKRRSAAQNAATAKLVAANKARRGKKAGKRRMGWNTWPKPGTFKPNRKAAGTSTTTRKRKSTGKKRRTPAQNAATARLVALNKAKRGGHKSTASKRRKSPARATSTRRAAPAVYVRPKKGKGSRGGLGHMRVKDMRAAYQSNRAQYYKNAGKAVPAGRGARISKTERKKIRARERALENEIKRAVSGSGGAGTVRRGGKKVKSSKGGWTPTELRARAAGKKPKKARTAAQIAATERMRASRGRRASSGGGGGGGSTALVLARRERDKRCGPLERLAERGTTEGERGNARAAAQRLGC